MAFLLNENADRRLNTEACRPEQHDSQSLSLRDSISRNRTWRSRLILIFLTSYLGGCGTSAPIDTESLSSDGLQRIVSSDFDQAYINPDSNFSQFREIYVTDLQIELQRDWVNNQNLSDPFRITERDIELIRKNISATFKQSLERGLPQKSQLRIVEKPGADTLWLRPAILQLNISNPDNLQPYQTVTLAEMAATMTIVLEVTAPANGATLARLSDRGRTRDYLNYSQQDIVKNQSDISKLFFDWAVALGNTLNSNPADSFIAGKE